MNFGEVLEAIKEGKKARRNGWNGKEQYIVLAYMNKCVTPMGVVEPEHLDAGSKFILFVGTRGYQPWSASQSDILSNDWEVF